MRHNRVLGLSRCEEAALPVPRPQAYAMCRVPENGHLYWRRHSPCYMHGIGTSDRVNHIAASDEAGDKASPK